MRSVNFVIAFCPDRSSLIRRLYLKDVRFRDMCETFALSVTTLRRFEDRPDSHLRPEIEEYRRIIRELETEIRNYLADAIGS